MSYAEKLGIQNNVKFMGYRRDIPELLAACDVAVSSSRQEGLPINIVEAMAMGKPIVATRVRGNSDLIVDQKGGFLINLNDSDAMANALLKIYELGCENNDMGKFNVKHVQNFSVNNVNVELKEIYKSLGVNFR
jgi:glycosyltransferase EpsD